MVVVIGYRLSVLLWMREGRLRGMEPPFARLMVWLVGLRSGSGYGSGYENGESGFELGFRSG
jgi:hypothetical protein